MAIQSFELDPNAAAYTDDEIVDKINSATSAITREAALSQDDLNIIKTNPAASEHRVRYLRLDSAADVVLVYESAAEV
jgi:hypothetical protein